MSIATREDTVRVIRPDLALTERFGAAVERTPLAGRRHRWLRAYAQWMVGSDFLAGLVAANLALLVRFGTGAHHFVRFSDYALASLAFPFLLVAAVASTRGYEGRFLGRGSEEYRRVFDGGVRLGALTAIVVVAARSDPARGYLAISFPVAIALALLGRFAGRRVLERMRDRGRCTDKVIVVGRERSVAELIRTVRSHPRSGFEVVGARLDTLTPREGRTVEGVPVYGGETDVLAAVIASGADTVAITSFSDLDDHAVRRLGWQLEGTEVSMLLAPKIIDVAGPRIHIRPVGGLPLLHVEEPELSGGRRLIKALLDRSSAAALLFLLSPFLIAIGIAIRLDSKGPAIFKQERVGTAGSTFTLWKFRTMHVNAEEMLAALQEKNEHGEVSELFKIKDDPRITSLGRHLRRFSIDELPQLVDVLLGRMSMVGPRPPLPREVRTYEDHAHRRLLVKPGLTGLWQISGRSDLSWDDTVRLDLQYIENWSLALDLQILCRTLGAVLRSTGAY